MASNALTRLPRLELIDLTGLPNSLGKELAALKKERKKAGWGLVKNSTGAAVTGVVALGSGALSWLAWIFVSAFPAPIAVFFAVAISIVCGVATFISSWFVRDAIDDVSTLKESVIPARLVREAETERLLETSAERINRKAMSWNGAAMHAFLDDVDARYVDKLSKLRVLIAEERSDFDEHLQRFRAVTTPLEPKALPPADDEDNVEAIDLTDTPDS